MAHFTVYEMHCCNLARKLFLDTPILLEPILSPYMLPIFSQMLFSMRQLRSSFDGFAQWASARDVGRPLLPQDQHVCNE